MLYVNRWVNAGVVDQSGVYHYREGRGTPQEGVISLLLTNLYLHYVLDAWLAKEWPNEKFVHYADDVIMHGRNDTEVKALKSAIARRLKVCGLEMHPEKTKLVFYRKIEDARLRFNSPFTSSMPAIRFLFKSIFLYFYHSLNRLN